MKMEDLLKECPRCGCRDKIVKRRSLMINEPMQPLKRLYVRNVDTFLKLEDNSHTQKLSAPIPLRV